MLQPILSKLTNSSITAGCHINSTKMIWILSLVICLRWWIVFFFFWDINFSYEKSIPLIYHCLILVCPARVKASSNGHAFKFIQCLPRNTRKGLMTSFLIFYINAKKTQYHYSKLTVPPLQALTTFDRAFYKLRWPGLCNLLSILVYAPALATRRLALHFLVPSV